MLTFNLEIVKINISPGDKQINEMGIFYMMYMHYCKQCQRTFMLNGHKMICPRCTDPLAELQISYLDYVNLGTEERERFKEACANEEQLHKLKTTYRMYKYSKWYKDLQADNDQKLPITTLLASLTYNQQTVPSA